MGIPQEIFKSIRITIALWVITALIYPLITFAIGQGLFSYQANGSLLNNAQGITIGSALIGQPFTQDRYFWSRPSTVNYAIQADVAQTGTSGASNLAPSNPALLDRIQADLQKLQQATLQPTADLLYTSGSGLDPHITIEAANAQIARVAQARQLTSDRVQMLMNQAIDRRFLGIFGEPGVNVLKLNLALDSLKTQT